MQTLTWLLEYLKMFVPSGKDHELSKHLYSALSTSEVAAKLCSAGNTSPDADHLEYAHLQRPTLWQSFSIGVSTRTYPRLERGTDCAHTKNVMMWT